MDSQTDETNGEGKVFDVGAMTNPLLPPELLQLVIDHLFDDKPSLAAWSLVSPQCAALAQPSLFHHVHLSLKDGAALQSFLEFLENALHIGGYVRELHIESSSREEKVRLELNPFTSVFLSIIRRLSLLHTLALDHVVLIPPDRVSPASTPDSIFTEQQSAQLPLTPLHTMKFRGMQFTDQNFSFLMKVFHVHSSLQFTDANWFVRPGGTTTSSTEVAAESLVLGIGHHQSLLEFILARKFSALTSLSVDVSLANSPFGYFHLLGMFLSCCTQLQHLRIALAEMDDFVLPSILESLQLTFTCPTLHSLHIRLPTIPDIKKPGRPTISRTMKNIILSILTSAPKASTSRITFDTSIGAPLISEPPGYSADHWNGISEALELFTELTSVRFVTHHPTKGSSPNFGQGSVLNEPMIGLDLSYQHFFTEYFAQIDGRGLLQFW